MMSNVRSSKKKKRDNSQLLPPFIFCLRGFGGGKRGRRWGKRDHEMNDFSDMFFLVAVEVI